MSLNDDFFASNNDWFASQGFGSNEEDTNDPFSPTPLNSSEQNENFGNSQSFPPPQYHNEFSNFNQNQPAQLNPRQMPGQTLGQPSYNHPAPPPVIVIQPPKQKTSAGRIILRIFGILGLLFNLPLLMLGAVTSPVTDIMRIDGEPTQGVVFETSQNEDCRNIVRDGTTETSCTTLHFANVRYWVGDRPIDTEVRISRSEFNELREGDQIYFFMDEREGGISQEFQEDNIQFFSNLTGGMSIGGGVLSGIALIMIIVSCKKPKQTPEEIQNQLMQNQMLLNTQLNDLQQPR